MKIINSYPAFKIDIKFKTGANYAKDIDVVLNNAVLYYSPQYTHNKITL